MNTESTSNVEEVVLDLHGSRAVRGVDVDALEGFLENLRRALRDFDRDQRGDMVGRGGHPDSRDAAVGAFRLVKFRIGSGILTLEPTGPKASGEAMDIRGVQHRSTRTLIAMLDAFDAGEQLSPAVLDALTAAVRALGSNSHFGVQAPSRTGRTVIAIDAIDARRRADDEEPRKLIVTGRLHLLDVAEPTQRVGVRAPDGVEWSCSYEPELKSVVMAALDHVVTVRGYGRKVAPLAGRMRLETLEVVPEYLQDELFTTEPLPVAELQERQGIQGPQGLDAVADHAWEDDDESSLFLEATLGEIV